MFISSWEGKNTKPPHPKLILLAGLTGKIKHILEYLQDGVCFKPKVSGALCRAFRNDSGHFNGAEQTISLANRVTSL